VPNYILPGPVMVDKIAAHWQRWRRCIRSRFF
jgi:hypothetical protein